MHTQLQKHLEPVARAFQKRALWRNLAWSWGASGGCAVLLILIRRFGGWSSPVAFFILLAAALAATGYFIFHYFTTPVDYLQLARQLEAENPGLRSLLLTAVEQKPLAGATELNYLQNRVIDELLAKHERQPLGERTFERLAIAQQNFVYCLLFCLLAFWGLKPHLAPGGIPWIADKNGISVTPGNVSLERGSGLVVLARFDGKLPAEATLVIKPVNENERRVPLARNLADPVFGGGLPEVKGDLSYRVESPTGNSSEYHVKVFEYPRLDRADARISYPGYTGLKERDIPDTRRVSAVEGSDLDYTFFLNKPVKSATLVGKDQPPVKLTVDMNQAAVYHTQFKFDQNHKYELVLVDDEGRTNKVPPEFRMEALPNRPAQMKLAFPRGDQRVSALEEMAFQAEVSDDFGVKSYGITYSMAGGEERSIELGRDSAANEKRLLKFVLPLESIGAQPDQLLSYYIWADDIGPDGKARHNAGDMFFAEVKPFDEVFREGQGNQQQQQQGGQQGGQQNSQSQKLSELQKQITSATWNLKRRETAAKPSKDFAKDAGVLRDSQQQALEQASAMKEEVEDSRIKSFLETAGQAMKKAAESLTESADGNKLAPLATALANEQAASQALLKLQSREYQVSRGQRGQRGSGAGQRAQSQIDQLDLKQSDNRYETQREATPTQNKEQREQLQVANRLKELAQRQEDLNSKLKELQTALQEAQSEKEKEEIKDQLKRLRDEQRDLLADVDELRQRMDQPENQSRMADEKQQLDQTRSDVQKASEALDKNSVSQALSSGTRAQRELKQLQDDFRRKTSGQFAEDMRKMREDARQLSQKEQELNKKLDDMSSSKEKKLDDSQERRELASQLAAQKAGLTNIYTQMRQVSEQSETAEPLLSKQLYDTIRQSRQEEMNKSLELASELVQRGFVPQASQFEERARGGIEDLKKSVEHAAESVLGDDTEALKLARQELENLRRELDEELARQSGRNGTNKAQASASGGNGEQQARGQGQNQRGESGGQQPGGERNNEQQAGAGQQPGSQDGQQGEQQNSGQAGAGGKGQRGRQGEGSQEGQQDGGQQGQASDQQQGQQANASGQQQGQQGEGGQGGQGGQGGNQGQRQGQGRNGQRGDQQLARGEQPGGNGGRRGGANENAGGQWRRGTFADNYGGAEGGGGGAGGGGPLVGTDFVNWSDRLRDVEEMVDVPELRSEVARIRDRARAIRTQYKKFGEKPDWAVVRLEISGPLFEVRSRLDEELARRASKEALVPLDRDPVPAKYSEMVRRYYEQLGKSE